MRELRWGTKVRDHQFPKPEAVYKPVYLERHKRRLKGFTEAQGQLKHRYSPSGTLRHKM